MVGFQKAIHTKCAGSESKVSGGPLRKWPPWRERSDQIILRGLVAWKEMHIHHLSDQKYMDVRNKEVLWFTYLNFFSTKVTGTQYLHHFAILGSHFFYLPLSSFFLYSFFPFFLSSFLSFSFFSQKWETEEERYLQHFSTWGLGAKTQALSHNNIIYNYIIYIVYAFCQVSPTPNCLIFKTWNVIVL